VEPVIVASNYRGQGIGKALLNHAIKKAKELGVLCLSVKPVARNLGAISFFHYSGFKILGHIQMFMWLGESDPDTWKPGPTIFERNFFI
jgi:GNAT superfamily N-acetyltransferase